MRLVTRGDLDGLACAAIITLEEEIEEIELIHPQDITEGRADIRSGDILANVPYHPSCAKWFDHHMHTATPAAPPPDFEGAFGKAPSAAHLVYDYYGGEESRPELAALVREADRLDSADLTPGDVVNPHGFVRLGLTLDGRTGLGAFKEYFMELLTLVRIGTPVEKILEQPEVKRRCDLMDQQNERFGEALMSHSRVDGNVVITDFRGLEETPVGNRFLVYAMFPKANVSVRLHWGPRKQFPMVLLGHSIFNRTCQTNVGELAARYGGGGHPGASSIPLLEEDPEQQIRMIIAELKANG